MKKLSFLLGCAAVLGATGAQAQLNKDVQSDKYIRNSVCLMMMEDESVPQKAILEEAFLNAEWPAKYNNHNIAKRVIKPSETTLCGDDKAAFNLCCLPTEQYMACKEAGTAAPDQKIFNEGMSQVFRQLMQGTTNTIDTVIKLNAARMANKYMVDSNVAKQLADSWFLDNAGNYTNNVMIERSLQSASEDEKEIAAAAAVGSNKILRESGYELVNNTFVVVTRFGYKPKDDLIADIILPMQVAAEFDPSGYAGMGIKAAEMGMKMSMGKGYYVTVDSYLFQLRWNDQIENSFNNFWSKEGQFLADKYNSDDIFSLQFIGNERAWAKTKSGVFSDKDETELIRMAAVDAVDVVLAKFEKKYDEFKTKTPLLVTETTDKKGKSARIYSARIGTKDGLKGGEVFEVLEKEVYVDADSVERVKYNKKGELKVSKKQIWDNLYSSEAEIAAAGKQEEATATLLEGSDKDAYYEGMLLRMKSSN